jgi:hypothetical protein
MILLKHNLRSFRAAVLDDSTADQPVKEMAIRRCETPPEMRMALGTNRDTPQVTGKPGEFRRCRSHIAATPGILVAGDFKNDALRVGKGVRVRAIDDPAFCRGGDHVQALPADDGTVDCRDRLILLRYTGINAPLPGCRIRPKKIQALAGHRWIEPLAADFISKKIHVRFQGSA